MAFVAVIPAVGSAVLPALGTAVGGLGSLASAIPVIGGSMGSLLGTGAAGSGIAGALGSLGAGSLGGAATALGSGLSGMIPAFGGMGTGMAGIKGGLGGLYGGADKLFGGMLPGGITPSQGFLGQMFPNAVGTNPVFGGPGSSALANLSPAEMMYQGGAQNIVAGDDAGFFGMGKKPFFGQGGMLDKGVDFFKFMDSMRMGANESPAAIQHVNNLKTQQNLQDMRNQRPVFSTMTARPSAVRQDIFSGLNQAGLGGALQNIQPYSSTIMPGAGSPVQAVPAREASLSRAFPTVMPISSLFSR